MADVHSKATRSYNMRMIKGKDTKPEMLVRRFLHAHGYRYILHHKKLPGKPDIVLPKYKTVIFVHGCFWHGHNNCKYYVVPKTRTQWWLNKINGNIANYQRKGAYQIVASPHEPVGGEANRKRLWLASPPITYMPNDNLICTHKTGMRNWGVFSIHNSKIIISYVTYSPL